MAGRRRSRQEWRELTDAWRISGISGVAFAEREGLNANTFSWWRSELGREARKPAASLSLVPVRMALVSAPIEIDLRDGVRLRVPETSDLGRVRDLVQLLRGL